jgi:hypothetical protein
MAVFGPRDTFRDVRTWYSRLALLEQQVCRIERLNGQPLGTGFLVASNLVMTGEHVVNPRGLPEPPPDVIARFDCAVSPETGAVLAGTPFSMDPSRWLVASSPTFGRAEGPTVGTAVIRLAEPAGLGRRGLDADVRGWVELVDAVAQAPESSSLAIMQHPEGLPLKVAFHTQAVLGIDPTNGRLMYRTDTGPGSSGAPCFDLDWKFVAMHEGRDVRGGNHNQGVPWLMIKEWLEGLQRWALVSERSPVRSAVAAKTDTGSPAETQFAMPPQLRQLVAGGEGPLIEFKQGIATALSAGDKKADARKVLKAVAAFMNSRGGGTVCIGIEDGGKIVGVDREYAAVNPNSPTWDGYRLYLGDVLHAHLDVDSPFRFFTVTRYHEQDKEICVIHVEPSDRPVFVDDVLYVRVEAQNRPLKGREVLSYSADRWSRLGDRPSVKVAPSAGLE